MAQTNGVAAPDQQIVAAGAVRDALPAPDLGKLQIVDSQTHAVGLIHPPPDIRKIVDKTALFVAKNGNCHTLQTNILYAWILAH
jgi:splicing factor 3A subunit 1